MDKSSKIVLGAVLVLGLLAGCGGGDGGGSGDGGRDARIDGRTGLDGGPGDAATDAPDAPASDGGPTDAATDATVPPDAPMGCETGTLPALRLVEVGRFNAPVYATEAPGRPGDLFVVEQRGTIRILRDGSILDPPFLDIRERVRHAGERGLLGLAFHPDFETNGRFFVYYTPNDAMRNVVAEYRRSTDDADQADPAEVRRLLEPMDPENNHNGGMLAFGPDGYLYVGMGDGGGGCDRHGTIGNALDVSSPFGKIHRLDVDAPERGFAAPDNPFVGETGLDTIWAIGLRNPWRFSFDRATGDLYVGDVGQDAWEEITVQPASMPGGQNYGWRDYEGPELSTASGCSPTGRVTEAEHLAPVVGISHGNTDEVVRDPCTVIGGYVYRGRAIDALRGYYLYGDLCSQDLGAFRYCEGRAVSHQRLNVTGGGSRLVSFGESLDGELYLVFITGSVRRLEPAM